MNREQERESDPRPLAYDMVVVGAGITGAGIARDAAMRGLSVCVVEKHDVAFGTSSRSTKLIHGGLRYLEHQAFDMVFESLSERHILRRIAPHLCRPLGFWFPVRKGASRPPWLIRLGMWLYDLLALFRAPRRHRYVGTRAVAEREPALNTEDLLGAALYYDFATDDGRLTLETLVSAEEHGATIMTHTEVVDLIRRDGTQDAPVQGVRIRPTVATSQGPNQGLEPAPVQEIHAPVVVSATGPWTDRFLRSSGADRASARLRPTKGIHVVVPREKLPVHRAVVCFHPDDGRVLFALPWQDHTYLGTTDTDDPTHPAEVHATGEDVAYLLGAARAHFPGHPLTAADVVSTWAGLRPLVVDADETDESAVSREHSIFFAPPGLVTIAGGKLTTYRRMAKELVDAVVKRVAPHLKTKIRRPLNTARVPLPGGCGWPKGGIEALVQTLAAEFPHVDRRTLSHLGTTFGVRASRVLALTRDQPELATPLCSDRPDIWAQLHFAVSHEFCEHLDDFMIRRTELFYKAKDQALPVVEPIARRMASLLAWNDHNTAAQIRRYTAEVERSRRFRASPDQRTHPTPHPSEANGHAEPALRSLPH